MAENLNVKIGADFGKLDQALQDTAVKIKSFDSVIEASGRSMQNMVRQFNGDKLRADAHAAAEAFQRLAKDGIGLTEAEQQKLNRAVTEGIAKYRAMSQEVPRHLLDVQRATEKSGGVFADLGAKIKGLGPSLVAGLSVGAVTAAASAYVEFAGSIADGAAKAGLSVEAYQRLKFAVEQSGGTIEAATKGIAKLGGALIDGDKGAVKAIGTLGLEVGKLRQMGPEQMFLTVADAIGKVPNPLEQSKLAMDLFGKAGLELLPAMKGGLSETAAEAEKLGLVMSSDAIDAADGLGDSFDKLKLAGMAMLGQFLTPLVPALTAAAEWLGSIAGTVIPFLQHAFSNLIAVGFKAIGWLYDLAASGAELAAKYGGPVAKALGITAESVKGLRDSAVWYRDAAAAQTAEIDKTGKAADGAAPKIRALGDATGDGGKAAKEAAKAIAEHQKAIDELTGAGKVAKAAELAANLKEIAAAGGTVDPARIGEFNKSLQEAIRLAGPLEADLGAGFVTLATDIQYAATAAAGLKIELQKLPASKGLPALDGIWRGGIQTGPSDKPTLGVPDASQIGKPAGKATAVSWLEGFKSENLGQEIGAVIVGAMQGGGDVGKSLGAMFGSKLVEGLAEKASSGISKVLGGSLGKALGDTVGAIIPGLGGLLGSALGGLVSKVFGPSAGAVAGKKADAEIASMQAKLLETYGSLDNIRKVGGAAGAALADAWGSKNVAGLAHFKDLAEQLTASVEKQNELLAEQADLQAQIADLTDKLTPKWADVEAAASKFGISIEGLGPAIGQLQATDTAKGLIDAFDTLTSAGGDVGGILVGMSDELSALAQKSIETGVTLPANLKPWIDELARSGQLVDDNGVALAGLGEIKYGEEVKSEGQIMRETLAGLKETLDKVAAALEGLAGKAGTAARGIAGELNGITIDPIDVEVRYDANGNVPVAHGGGLVLSTGRIRRFHSGGLAGDEMLAVLQHGEAVLSRAAVSRLGAPAVEAINRGGTVGAPVSVALTVNAIDAEGVDRVLVGKFLPAMRTILRDNRGDERTRLRAALGVA